MLNDIVFPAELQQLFLEIRFAYENAARKNEGKYHILCQLFDFIPIFGYTYYE